MEVSIFKGKNKIIGKFQIICYTIYMNKKLLRKIYKKKRDSIENKSLKDNIIFNKIITNKDILSCDTLLIYVSFNSEVNTINIIKHFIKTKRIAVPKIINSEMKFCYIESLNDLSVGTYNILEPTNTNYVQNFKNSICIVPALCFDKNNYRVGYGKGYYDKFLNNINIKTIGLCYKECITNKIDCDKYDKKIDYVITD